MTSPFLRNLYADARPGFCPCGDPLPKHKTKRFRMCQACRDSYQAVYGVARRGSAVDAKTTPVLIELRRLERLAASAVRRAIRSLRVAP